MIFYRKIFDRHCFTHTDANNGLGVANAGQTHMFSCCLVFLDRSVSENPALLGRQTIKMS